MSEKGKKNKKKTGLGLAIWILLFLIILIVFLVKQEEIKENFDKSGATALIEKKIGKDIFEDKKDSPKSEETGEIVIDLTKNLRKSEPVAKTEEKKEEPVKKQEKKSDKKAEEKASKKKAEAEKTVQPVKPEKTEVTLKPAEKTESKPKPEEKRPESPKTERKSEAKETQSVAKTESPSQKVHPKVEPKAEPKAAPQLPANTTKAKICFVAIDSEGPVVRKIVSRTVHKDSPMGDALNQLLQGPSSGEASTGCRSLIPAGTRLLSASIKNGVAILNFSEEFQFNQFGAEGSLAQLMQVVYTATEFSTVKSVQIMIEGQKKDYLTEGVWIGSPLNRSSF